jgi:alpha-L-fucosidase
MKKVILLPVIIFFIINCIKNVSPPDQYGPVPTENQMRWHEIEYYGLVCYGLNTYTRQEWGYGDVDPGVFTPSDLNTDQWARVARDAGMKGLILVAKHHDGFCLWPSETTDYTIAATTWKDGKGDVLGDLAKSCEKYGLKLGVYISPWDRNHAEYGGPEYVEAYHDQWREALEYSDDIWECWFDGANGGTGYYGGAREKRTIDKGYYKFPELFKIIKERQPKAIFFGYVEDITTDVVRWGGTEQGTGSETNWCRFDDPTTSDLELLKTGKKDGKYWMPVEGNTTILYPKKWYYNEYSKPRTLKNFVDLYYTTIGQNATFILGLSIGPDGRMPERDVKAMLAQKKQIDRELSENLAEGAKITAHNHRGRDYKPENAADGSTDTYWATADSVKESAITIDFDEEITFNRLLLQEYIQLGQRVHEFYLETENNGEWNRVAGGTTIGYKRILRFNNVKADKAKISFITDAPCLAVSNIEIYNAPPLLEEPSIACDKDGMMTITASGELGIYYALGKTPSETEFKKFEKPFEFPDGGVISAYTLHETSGKKSDVISREFGIAKSLWKIHSTDKSEPGKWVNAIYAIDGDPNTFWTVPGESGQSTGLSINMGEIIELTGFSYIPPELGSEGIIFEYEFYTSMDGKNWGAPVSSGEFSNIENNPIAQNIKFKKSISTRYVKLVSKSTVKNSDVVSIGEIDVFVRK